MRISTQMMYEQNMRGVTDSQSKWLSLGEQLSSGKRVNRPSEDPVAASQAVVLSQAQAQNSQYTTARSFATQKSSIEEIILSRVTTAIQSAQTTVVGISNATLSDNDRDSLATQLEGIRDQLLNLANSTDGNGNYVFAGYKTNSQPFTTDGTGKVNYGGGTEAITQQVDSARTMVIGHTGSQVFQSLPVNPVKEPGGGTGSGDMFAILNQAITSLRVPLDGADDATKAVQQAKIDATSRGLTNSLNNVLSVRAELGTQLSELDKLDSQSDERAMIQTQQMSDLIDVDWNSAISAYTMQQAGLQAAYKTFSDMQGMSLFQLNQ